MSKIAPVLTLVVQTLGVDNEDRFAAKRELRALLAVARAAEKEAHGFMLCTPSGLRCEHTLCALIRALARLRGTEGRGTR